MLCQSCGARASLSEWASASASDKKVWTRDEAPPDSKIVRKEIQPDHVIWNIPASGKFGFLFVFAILWLAITALVSGGFLIAFLTGGEIEGDMPGWVLIPFFGIFWAVGLGVLYAGLREKYLKCSIEIGKGRVLYRKEMFGKSREKALDLKGVTSISQQEFYQQNYKPVYGVEIKGAEGKIRFGTVLSEEEKAWLLSDFKKVVALARGEKQRVAESKEAGGFSPMAVGNGKSVFSIPFPKPKSNSLIGTMFMVLMAVGFVCIGIFVLGPDSPIPNDDRDKGFGFDTVFDFLDNGFRVIWTLFSSVFVIIGLVMLFKTLARLNKDVRIEGNEAQISLRTYKNHLVVSDRSFPRGEVTDVRSSNAGSLNNVPMKRIELIVGNKVEKISDWISEDEADRFVMELREALGK